MREEIPEIGRGETQSLGVGTGLRQERSSLLSNRRRKKKRAGAGVFVTSVAGSQRSPSQMHSIFYKEEQVRIFAKREEV